MRFKLDENFGISTRRIFKSEGYDVETVYDEGISGCSDTSLFEKCSDERRCLVTMDLDFSDILRFPPSQSNGIVIFRVPKNSRITMLEHLVKQYLKALKKGNIDGNLCIVEAGKIRIHEDQETE